MAERVHYAHRFLTVAAQKALLSRDRKGAVPEISPIPHKSLIDDSLWKPNMALRRRP
jgi:hypothetical protein